MSRRVISRCPVCNSNLEVTRLECKKCGTIIQNEFELSKFAYLKKDQLNFIKVFVKCRGNIKDVEKELGVSYPTVRAKLDDAISALGYTVDKNSKNDKKKILEMVEQGTITPDEALEMIKE
ncbi:DUF2089 domain-containing protein [Haloimpatiens sp. FM7330]|uniref:DUF2089 domain-containing protein n=1 Tax=Haloimpatiens sp. FM7330 TaxID=3298610 RepID=UPI00362734B1